MKVKYKNIIGTIAFNNKELYFFKAGVIYLKLIRAELEFINPESLMITGFEKYNSEKEEYQYKRCYFEVMGEK
ncbi:MAG: hypothetical protein GTO02_00010 [Candidatus Dadabacteria bacterium]|nr:hypothetical protein [Candidatus Dadabacteria bacterium]NIQ12834.1 hypothetical protein [Candidatus Dadabacteria bacterium]